MAASSEKEYLKHCAKTIGVYIAVVIGMFAVLFIMGYAMNGWRLNSPSEIEYRQCLDKNAKEGTGSDKGYLIIDDEVRDKCLKLDD